VYGGWILYRVLYGIGVEEPEMALFKNSPKKKI